LDSGAVEIVLSMAPFANELAQHVEPTQNFDSQRRLNAYAPILQRVFSPDADDRHEVCCAMGRLKAEWAMK